MLETSHKKKRRRRGVIFTIHCASFCSAVASAVFAQVIADCMSVLFAGGAEKGLLFYQSLILRLPQYFDAADTQPKVVMGMKFSRETSRSTSMYQPPCDSVDGPKCFSGSVLVSVLCFFPISFVLSFRFLVSLFSYPSLSICLLPSHFYSVFAPPCPPSLLLTLLAFVRGRLSFFALPFFSTTIRHDTHSRVG